MNIASNQVVPVLEGLESRLLMANSVLASLTASAQSIVLNTPGEIAIAGDLQDQPCDAYEFTAPASGKIQINMNASDFGLDTILRVFDSRGRRIAYNNNASKGTTDSRITIKAVAGRTYYVVADSRSGSGSYSLSWLNKPADDYGNTIDTAGNLRTSKGTSYTTGRINYAGDLDVFKFIASSTGTLNVNLNAIGSGISLDTELIISDASGLELARNDDYLGSTNSYLSIQATEGETYYFTVKGYEDSRGRYKVTAKISAPATQPPQQNNGASAPTNVPLIAQATNSITAQVLTTDSGMQLLVVGTDMSDLISLSQTTAGIALTTSAGSQNFEGAFTSIVVYGFGGDDTIRTNHTVTAGVWISGGDGNDSLFIAGSGQALMFGGAGDDLIITIGGGSAVISGGSGFDSFWYDSADRLTDGSAAEAAANALHEVTQFYQPYTTNQSSTSYVPLTIAGQDFQDPRFDSQARAYRNFANVPLTVGGFEYDDVEQGAVGDCYLLASLSALAQSDPGILNQSITSLGDGTFAVRFYRNGQAVYVRVDADLPVTSGSNLAYASLGPDGELWVAIMEKAYAHFRYGSNSYASISGGWMADVFAEVANASSSYRSTGGSASSLFNYFQSHLNAGHAVTLGSNWNASGPIVGSHAYMVESVTSTEQGQFVTIFNPWGVDGKPWDGNSSDGLITLSVAQVQQYFSAAVTCLA